MAKAPEAVEVKKVEEQVDAQVAPPRDPDADKVTVHEVSVRTDYVVTDPNSDLAVQVPDDEPDELPIHRLEQPSPEEALESGEATPAEEKPHAGTSPTTTDQAEENKS